jgi:Family of unknown function (DUF5681)
MDKPPRSTRFKPGHSGNPRGRPKSTADFGAIYHEVSNEKISTTSNGKRTSVTAFKAMLLRLRQSGFGGDVRAMKEFVQLRKEFPRPDEPQADLTAADWDDVFVGYDAGALDNYREITAKEKTVRDLKRKRKIPDGTR